MTAPITPALSFPLGRPTRRPTNDVVRAFGALFQGRTAIAYDPQDLTTLFQDAAGTLPVYRPGSGAIDPPVRLMMDKGQGLGLGPELIASGWPKSPVPNAVGYWYSAASGVVVSDGFLEIATALGAQSDVWYTTPKSFTGRMVTIEIDATVSAGTFQVCCGGYAPWSDAIGASGIHTVTLMYSHALANNRVYIRVSSDFVGEFASCSAKEIKGYHAYQNTTTASPTLSGRYNLLTATETLSTQSVTTVATAYTLSFSGAGTVTLSGTATGPLSAGTHTITCTAGTLTLTVAGSVTKADLRVKRDGSSLPAYQSVTDANTYDTAGFPLFLKRDKVDDDLIVQAPAITGAWAHGTIDGPIFGTVAIPAGEYHPFGTGLADGLPDCTQWIAIDGTLSASEQAVFERYVYSKARNIANSGNSTSLYRGFASRNELRSIRLRSKSYSNLQQCFYLSKVKDIEILSVEQSSGSAQGLCQNATSLLNIAFIGPVFSGISSVSNAFEGSKVATLDISNQRFSSLTSAASFCRFCPNLTTVSVGAAFDDTPCTNFYQSFGDTNLNQASIDAILVSINNAGTSNGTFNQSGGSAPSATGQAAITAMRSRGWTVTVTGGF